MQTLSTSLTADVGARSQKLALSSGTIASSLFTTPGGCPATVVVTPNADCFFRFTAGSTASTALADGTDAILLAGNSYRVMIPGTGKLSFITSGGTGYVYLTPEF